MHYACSVYVHILLSVIENFFVIEIDNGFIFLMLIELNVEICDNIMDNYYKNLFCV